MSDTWQRGKAESVPISEEKGGPHESIEEVGLKIVLQLSRIGRIGIARSGYT